MFHTFTLNALPWLGLALCHLTNAACECGYSLNSTNDANHAVFTELHENDFLHISSASINLSHHGWRPQVYNMSANESRGPYGKHFELDNVVTNPFRSAKAWSGDTEHGGDAGLELWVRGDHSQGHVSSAEMATVRNDTLLGSFRVGMKLSNSSGTCGAFFFYHNNSQEIDLELLSRQFNTSGGAINLVLQSTASVNKGYDASGTSGFQVQHMPFRPDQLFHEYRFDWLPDRVQFFVDGKFLYEMTENIPTDGGALFLNHWSNGDPRWSAGPPERDTVMTISYVKAYFNSTDTERSQIAFKQRCPTYDASKVCAIPTQSVPPDVSTRPGGAKTYFFSMQGDMAPGQVVYMGTARNLGVSVMLGMVVVLLVGGILIV